MHVKTPSLINLRPSNNFRGVLAMQKWERLIEKPWLKQFKIRCLLKWKPWKGCSIAHWFHCSTIQWFKQNYHLFSTEGCVLHSYRKAVSTDIGSPKTSAREQGALTFASAGTREAHRQAQGGKQHLSKAWQTSGSAEQDHTQHSRNTQGHYFIFPISTYSAQTALWERTWGISFTKNQFRQIPALTELDIKSQVILEGLCWHNHDVKGTAGR